MTADTSSTAALAKPPSLNRLIVAATIGNVLEWFDFVVYGFFAVTIAEVFFPAGDPTVSLLITFGAFGLAYFVRPLGAIDSNRPAFRPARSVKPPTTIAPNGRTK